MIRISDEMFQLVSVDAESSLAAAEMAIDRFADDFAIGAAYTPAEMNDAIGSAMSAADLPEAARAEMDAAAGTPPAN